eukprot:3426963-Ditylum_brightwellii.AAC.1
MHASEAFLQWTDSNMQRDAQLTMPSVLALDAGIALVNAPRSHPNYRLPPHEGLFRWTLPSPPPAPMPKDLINKNNIPVRYTALKKKKNGGEPPEPMNV